ncbi:alpha/beta fold hydrolase [Nannocystis pusilla]|uniref:alpha/beta fold hydrolase n=1 Tax=Nannocystis pusilla TaxID=889268 RepID=UPI003B76A951
MLSLPACGDAVATTDTLDPSSTTTDGSSTEPGTTDAPTTGTPTTTTDTEDGTASDGDSTTTGAPSTSTTTTTDATTDAATTGSPPQCGNQIIEDEDGEECDDGPDNGPGQACLAGCLLNVCGDGDQGPGEGCDDGNTAGRDGCSADCVSELCGDGVVQAGLGEACDDGNTDPDDGCSAACLVEACGDGVVQVGLGETCDDGNTDPDDGCSATCVLESCGDGVLTMELGETCDDGNTVSEDGCSDTCAIEACGDGVVQAGLGETCDDGNTDPDDGCGPTCETEACGDGVVQAGEDCDDGNDVANDGCSPTCEVEVLSLCGPGQISLLVNEGFESGALAPWTTNGGVTVTMNPHDGVWAAQATDNWHIQQTFAAAPVAQLVSANSGPGTTRPTTRRCTSSGATPTTPPATRSTSTSSCPGGSCTTSCRCSTRTSRWSACRSGATTAARRCPTSPASTASACAATCERRARRGGGIAGRLGLSPVRMRPRPLALAALALSLAGGCLKIPTEASKAPETGSEGQVTLSWPGAAVDKLYRPGEVRVYTMMQSGKPIGTSWGRYEGPVDGEPGHFRFATRIELRPPGRDGKPAEPLRSSGEIVVDARGDLVRGFERSNAAELTFERKGDAIHFSSGRERDEITYRSGDAFMAFSAIFHEELMFGLRRLEAGELAWRLVSLSGSMPTEWTATLTIPDPAAPGRATVKTNLGETIALRDGRIEKIQIEADDVEVQVPVQPPTWPEWAIAGPPVLEYSLPPGAKFTRREVELPGRPGEPALAGEVLLPPGNGPFPGALLLPGTGQQDRFGFAGPPPVDLGSHSITDALAEAGFAVLRFDERGFGSSAEGPVSYLGQLEDARRALRTLLVQDEVDPDRIVLVGHGEGGWKALTLAAEDPSVKAVALLATPAARTSRSCARRARRRCRRCRPSSATTPRRRRRRRCRRSRPATTCRPSWPRRRCGCEKFSRSPRRR